LMFPTMLGVLGTMKILSSIKIQLVRLQILFFIHCIPQVFCMQPKKTRFTYNFHFQQSQTLNKHVANICNKKYEREGEGDSGT
jgi:hypothetical protein